MPEPAFPGAFFGGGPRKRRRGTLAVGEPPLFAAPEIWQRFLTLFAAPAVGELTLFAAPEIWQRFLPLFAVPAVGELP